MGKSCKVQQVYPTVTLWSGHELCLTSSVGGSVNRGSDAVSKEDVMRKKKGGGSLCCQMPDERGHVRFKEWG
jgi:hypothetical protein